MTSGRGSTLAIGAIAVQPADPLRPPPDPRRPDVVPPDDPNYDRTEREPNIDPPPTDPGVDDPGTGDRRPRLVRPSAFVTRGRVPDGSL